MKKIIFALVLLPSLCFAGSVQDACKGVISKKNTVTTCDTAAQKCEGTTNAAYENFGATANVYRASKFTASATEIVCSVDLYMLKVGTPTFNIKVAVYSHDAVNDKPNALVGSWSANKAGADIPAGTWGKFTGMSASITNETTYWKVLYTDGNDGSNYGRVYRSDDCGTGRTMYSADGSSWTQIQTGDGWLYRFYKQ